MARAGGGRPVEQRVGVDEGQVADEDGEALAEAARPRRRSAGGVHGVLEDAGASTGRAPAGDAAVHHVVVDEGEGVQQLEGGAGVDDPGVAGSAPAPDGTPEAERRAQPLAAGRDEAASPSNRPPSSG